MGLVTGEPGARIATGMADEEICSIVRELPQGSRQESYSSKSRRQCPSQRTWEWYRKWYRKWPGKWLSTNAWSLIDSCGPFTYPPVIPDYNRRRRRPLCSLICKSSQTTHYATTPFMNNTFFSTLQQLRDTPRTAKPFLVHQTTKAVLRLYSSRIIIAISIDEA